MVLRGLAAVLRRVAELFYGSDARWFREELAESSRELGVRFRPIGPFAKSADGTWEDFSVRVEMGLATPPRQGEAEAEPNLVVHATVSGPGIPAGLTLVPKGEVADEVLTGDSVFDEAVAVLGETSVVLALLTPELRRRLVLLVSLGGRLEGGRLSSRTSTLVRRGVVRRALQSLLALALDLASSEGGGLCERLLRNARTDPQAGVRLANLSVLQERFASTPEARQASAEGLQDASPWVRLSAARFAGDEGREVLEALVRDRHVPDDAAAEAVVLLAVRLPVDRAGPILVEALKSRTGDARRQAIDALAHLRYAPALGPIVVLVERADAATASAAAAALGSFGDAKAEPALLEAVLGKERDLRLAAVRALARVGTVRAVEPLLGVVEAAHPDAETREAVREAVSAIQSRLLGAEAGQLSLAASGDKTGWLSVPRAQRGSGELSLAPETRDRES